MGRVFSRRQIIRYGLGAGAAWASGSSLASGLGSGAISGGPQRAYSTAVVIGSGFGGSVAALRLTKAGIDTALIERGRSWTYRGPDTFPTIAATAGDGRTTWLASTDAFTGQSAVPIYTGLVERIKGDNTDVLCAAGLGGGSLVYGGVLLQPTQSAFEQVFPTIDYDQMDRVYYPRVRARVSGGPIPDDILQSERYVAMRRFMDDATAAGLELAPSDVGFNWNIIREEIAGQRVEAASIGEYIYGCNSGAKNTLDRNYLRAARRSGRLDTLVLHQVMRITQVEGGGYCVHCDVLDTDGEVLLQRQVFCRYLFLAAGSSNTTKLLLRARANGDLPALSDDLGQYWGNNGDELTAVSAMTESVGTVQGGPAAIAARDPGNTIKPVAFMHSPTTNPAAMQFQLGMSIPDRLGSLSYDPAQDTLTVNWPTDALTQSHTAYMDALQRMTQNDGGNAFSAQMMNINSSWHPCGGAVMGKVCSDHGEVYGHANLFVVDGALLPGSAAMANPSLTIAANAERIMDALIPQLIRVDTAVR